MAIVALIVKLKTLMASIQYSYLGESLPDEALFKNPPSEFRGAPFWSINDKLDPEEVMRQVGLLDEGGYGGAFFHAREGLVTPFLGEEWFKAFKAAVDEAKRRNMYIWIYDELWWPSGFAGGMVPALGPKYRAKALLMIPSERAYGGEEVIVTFKCKLDSKGLPSEYEPAEPGEEGGDYVYLSFVKYVAPTGETWFSGFSYVDLLDPDVVKKFLDVAYAPYVERFKDEIGKTIPGVFTDEPNFSASRPIMPRLRPPGTLPPRGPRMPPFAVPWTDSLPERFKELNGYDIIERLPELFIDVGDYMKTRYDFWRTVTILFLEAFSKQIYEWCDKHGLKFTGHYLAEDTLLSQLICIGAAMPHYEYQHVPGIDHLGMQVWNSLLTAKQVASVANQLGRERVLCETYGCTGNYPSFSDRKWIGDWLYAMGVNFLNHHLVPYSMRGRRKKDYGLNFHWSQPWWKYNKLLEYYFARLSYMLSRGKRLVNVLVIHPIGSAWALMSPLNPSRVMQLDEQFKMLLRALLAMHVDFELGDEMLMEKYAKVDGKKLCIGRMAYDVVILPPSVTLASSTVKLLREFVNAGGTLIAIAPAPSLVDGRPSDEIKKLLDKAKVVEKVDPSLITQMLKDIPRPVLIEGDEEGDVLYHLRQDEDSLILFLANTSKERDHSLRIGIEGSFRVEIWDPLSGERSVMPAEAKDGRTWWSFKLEPVGSGLFVLRPGSPRARAPAKGVKIHETSLKGKWKVKRHDLNVLVLDYCRYRTRGAWSELVPVWKAHDAVIQGGLGTKFSLRFEFESEIEFKGRRAFLVVENPERFKILVNGVEVRPEANGHWLDWNFPMIDVSQWLGKGLNVIELEGIVNLEPELENIYLLGDFAVKAAAKGSSKIVEEAREVELGNLCEKGYPFYAGTIELEREVDVDLPRGARAFLRLEGLKAALAVIYVNEEEAGKVIAAPYEVEITEALRQGSNRIRVLLVGTLRNALGPLHHSQGDPSFIGPETFRDVTHWTDEYMLKPFGVENISISFFK